eukprot:m.1604657 g.1604657  ORF g.1604657 m.1604657 type:complete len:155 (+) comp25358_c0_seq12:189-653(+)
MPRSPNGGGADFDHLRRVSRSMHQDEDEAEGNELPNIPASATRAPGKTRMSKRERKQSNQRTTVPPILMSAPLPVSSPLYSAETSPVAISPKPLYDNKSTTQQFLDEDEEDGEFQGMCQHHQCSPYLCVVTTMFCNRYLILCVRWNILSGPDVK